jgi:formamidopyrimidine-DNA glycosylase
MPELPEVETIKRDLRRLMVGKIILAVWTDTPKMVQPSMPVVKKAVVGRRIKKIGRRAKLLQVFLDNKQILAVHLKMTGRLLFRNKGDKEDRWTHVIFKLNEGKELRFADLRKFGWVRLLKNQAELEKILAELGPEPMDDLDLKTFRKVLASSHRPVKVTIMDQKKISGVGNIYACDALFLARIDPRRLADQLSEKDTQRLLRAINKVLRAGIRYRGASDQYYLDALGHKGAYQDHFLVYNREGKKCFECQGKVKKIKLAGRGTYYCPACQK